MSEGFTRDGEDPRQGVKLHVRELRKTTEFFLLVEFLLSLVVFRLAFRVMRVTLHF